MTEYAAGQLYLDSGDVLWIAKTAGSAPTWAGVQGLCTVATTTGPPTSGYWSKGQQYLDSNDVLWICTASGTPGTWVQANAPVSCRVHTSGSVTDVNTTLSGTICPFDTIDWDTAGGFSTSTHQYTVQVAGKYRVTGFWKRYTKTAVGITCWFKKNGSTILPAGTSGGATGALSSSYTSNVGSVATDLVQCAVNDTLELVYLDYGGGANAGGSMTIERIGP